MRIVLIGDAESPHLLKWARALDGSEQVELWVASSRGFLREFDALVPAARRLALGIDVQHAGGNLGGPNFAHSQGEQRSQHPAPIHWKRRDHIEYGQNDIRIKQPVNQVASQHIEFLLRSQSPCGGNDGKQDERDYDVYSRAGKRNP